MTMLPITLTIAGAATLVNLWLAVRVSRLRMSRKVSIGDGGDTGVQARMRAHANFVEYTPFFLILLALVELAEGPRPFLWLAGIAFILARLAHAFGMDRPAPNPFRMGGIMVTFLCLLGLAGYGLTLPYLAARATTGVVTTVQSIR